MSLAVLLAFGAGAVGVLAAWETLAAVEGTSAAARLDRLLEPLARAGREGRAPTGPERRRLALVAAAGLLAAGWLLGGAAVAVVAALAGPAAVLVAVRVRRRRYRDEVRRGAAGAARALADALSAGHSVRGALARAGGDAHGAPGHELRQAARALAVGERTETVLEALRRRAASRPWDTMVAAILLQRDAGGDLAGLLRELAGSLETAERLERDARAATAQARLTAWLVVALPMGAAALAEIGSPGFLAGLLAHPLSAWLTGLALVLQVMAIVAVRALARPRRLA